MGFLISQREINSKIKIFLLHLIKILKILEYFKNNKHKALLYLIIAIIIIETIIILILIIITTITKWEVFLDQLNNSLLIILTKNNAYKQIIILIFLQTLINNNKFFQIQINNKDNINQCSLSSLNNNKEIFFKVKNKIINKINLEEIYFTHNHLLKEIKL